MAQTCPPRIALIHATRLAMEPVDAAFRELWPGVEPVSLLDEALSIDRAREGALTPPLHDRIVRLARHAESIGAVGVLYTCSAFGAAIEEAARTSPVPVLRPNEAMFDTAFSHGDRVAMIHTFEPAVAGMEAEFRAEAARRGSTATIVSSSAGAARAALRNGDVAAHNTLIAQAAASVRDADVILLAHFSMARAQQATSEATPLPVLTAPHAAVLKLKAALAG